MPRPAYIPWNVRKQRKHVPPKRCPRHKTPVNAKATFRRIGNALGISMWAAQDDFTRGLEKLAERRAAQTWLEDLPTPLWFPRNISVECNREYQQLYGE